VSRLWLWLCAAEEVPSLLWLCGLAAAEIGSLRGPLGCVGSAACGFCGGEGEGAGGHTCSVM
jgi:hypothetical protein